MWEAEGLQLNNLLAMMSTIVLMINNNTRSVPLNHTDQLKYAGKKWCKY